MSRHSLFCFVCVCATVVLTSVVGAQNDDQDTSGSPGAEGMELEQARLSFAVYQWPNEKILMGGARPPRIPQLFYDSPQGPRPVRITPGRSTALMPYVGPSPLVLYTVEERWTDPPADAPEGTVPSMERVKKPAIRIDSGEGEDRIMIVVFPARKSSSGLYRTFVLPYDQPELSEKSVRFHNASDRLLALKFENTSSKMVKLVPRQSVDFELSGLKTEGTTRLFFYELDPEDNLVLSHTTRVSFRDESINFFLVYPKGRRHLDVLKLGSHSELDPEAFRVPTPEAGLPQTRSGR